MFARTSATLILALQLFFSAHAQNDTIKFSPCPLIGAYYPPPSSSSIQESGLATQAKRDFDELIQNGGHKVYGKIFNTTSFSVVYFTGFDAKPGNSALFEYHHTSPRDTKNHNVLINSDTKFPLAQVSMVFTVYGWLLAMGEQWTAPITKFLPQLRDEKKLLSIPWEDITIGDLAGHTSGLPRTSSACVIGKDCKSSDFLKAVAPEQPVFLPSTSPMISYTSFQLLAAAMESTSKSSFAEVLESKMFKPLNLNSSGLLGQKNLPIFVEAGLNRSLIGEPAFVPEFEFRLTKSGIWLIESNRALSIVSTLGDLARAGTAMLSSKLASKAITRRWLHHNVDTSNLRNGVGYPWEIYRAGSKPINPIIDIFTKSGALGSYASYFGISPDLKLGFAIVAHDETVTDGNLDLNVYVDLVSESIQLLQGVAGKETATAYSGKFTGGNGNSAVLSLGDLKPGIEIKSLLVNGTDVKKQVAEKMGVKLESLDYRLYPTNIRDSKRHQFVAVLQDRDAPVDAGTPTCITWQSVGTMIDLPYTFVFELDGEGKANAVTFGRGEGEKVFSRA
ncbi:hypothetical protein QQS21_011510 [Conoideocrella luteorostrata]|uniref:Beta-lactamase-related domain-containing protein n=1 Tax=Conoideocrella luteorostrata TaxID=1105319 RepID=A0AAJ0FVT6_9HYPO|nr:hypothetical protein QQS21_011510 [Conoideocrella luteorostrata]